MGCSLLNNLSGLDGLTTINGDLHIEVNPSLTSLSGLENIDPGSIADLYIYSNYSLSSCHARYICDYLASPNGTIGIEDNAPGCNSPEEVQDSCEAHAGIIDGLSFEDGLLIYPNPSNSSITIELPTQPSKYTFLIISNTNGQLLITQSITKPQSDIDISHLPNGIYIVKMRNNKNVMVQKVIKQY